MSEHTIAVTETNFADEVERDGLVLVYFWATWCGPCRIVAPIVDDIAAEYSDRIVVGKVDVDANQELATRFGIRSIPTLMLFRDGEPVETVVGAVPRAVLAEKIDAVLP